MNTELAVAHDAAAASYLAAARASASRADGIDRAESATERAAARAAAEDYRAAARASASRAAAYRAAAIAACNA